LGIVEGLLKFGGEFLKIHKKYLLLDIAMNVEMRVMWAESRSGFYSDIDSCAVDSQ